MAGQPGQDGWWDEKVVASVQRTARRRVGWLADLLAQERKLLRNNLAAASAYKAKTVEQRRAFLAPHRQAQEEIQQQIMQRLREAPDDQVRAAAICMVCSKSMTRNYQTFAWFAFPIAAQRARGWTADEVAALVHGLVEWKPGNLQPWSRQVEVDPLDLPLTAAAQLDDAARRAVAPVLPRLLQTPCFGSYGWQTWDEKGAQRSFRQQLAALVRDVAPRLASEVLLEDTDQWSLAMQQSLSDAAATWLIDYHTHLRALTRPVPSAAWRRRCMQLLDRPGGRECVHRALRALVTCRRAWGKHRGYRGAVWEFVRGAVVAQDNADLARGVVWAAWLDGGQSVIPAVITVAHRTAVEDPTPKVAGAAFRVLADSSHPDALAALQQLPFLVEHGGLRRQLDVVLPIQPKP